jgi:hypothetical protein
LSILFKIVNTAGPRYTAWDKSVQNKLKGLHKNREDGMNYRDSPKGDDPERIKYDEKIAKLTEKRLIKKQKDAIEDAKKSKAEEKGVVWDENERARLFNKLLKRSDIQESDQIYKGSTLNEMPRNMAIDELKDPRLMKLGRFAQSNIYEKEADDLSYLLQKKSKVQNMLI